jgi:hypothetical protein
MRSKYNLGFPLYFKTRYGFGITKGTVCGLHDDFVKVLVTENESRVAIVRFEDVLSVYE